MSDQVQIVTTDAGHHIRIVASNGEPIATTEVYPDRRNAEHAIVVLARAFGVGAYSEGNIVYVDERAP